jgi:pimeloyl-ACP methyl ester carboxylesterase
VKPFNKEMHMNSFSPVTAQEYTACLDYPSKIIETKLGSVECAVRGEGPALLSVHGGGCGGFDSGMVMAECFRKNGFKIVSPSRPGYLRTPIERGTSFEEQADLLAALLDAMELPSLAVIGASAGGPPSYLLAQRHPEKVSALLEIDSACIHYTKAQELSKIEETLYLSRPGLWLVDFFARRFPAAMVRNFLETESTLEKHELGERVRQVVKDPAKLAFIQVFTKMMSDYAPRKTGTDNDIKYMCEIDRLPLEHIACPTLIMHGDADADVPIAHAEYAHHAIKGSEMRIIHRASHIGFFVSDEAEQVQQEAVAWLRKHTVA